MYTISVKVIWCHNLFPDVPLVETIELNEYSITWNILFPLQNKDKLIGNRLYSDSQSRLYISLIFSRVSHFKSSHSQLQSNWITILK